MRCVVTTTALLLAQKVWDDNPLANADFSVLYPVLNIKDINALELRFLLLLQYKVCTRHPVTPVRSCSLINPWLLLCFLWAPLQLTVTASLYARYYFELRTICESDSRICHRPLNVAQAAKLELRSREKEAQSKGPLHNGPAATVLRLHIKQGKRIRSMTPEDQDIIARKQTGRVVLS